MARVKTHKLKIVPRFFEDAKDSLKRAEIRKNDRGFKVGDHVFLQEYDGDYTGQELLVEISNIVTSDDFPDGLKDGYCMFSFRYLKFNDERTV